MRRTVLLLAAFLCGCASPPPRPRDVHAAGGEGAIQAYLTELITHEMREQKVPGLSIAVVDDQRVVWSQGFGLADQVRRTPATADTLYRVGSISKLFTDIAAMQLVEQGRLNLDQPVQTWLPRFDIRQRTGGTAAITPRMLMTHHAGLPRDILKGFMTASPEPFAKVVERLRDEQADYPPGQLWSYSNLGVTVLGSVVEQLAGEPFADSLQRTVLRPMGLSTGAAFETGLSLSPLMAQGHLGHQPATEPHLRDVPAGGLNASANDLARFMSTIFADGMHDGQRILRPESVAEMLRPQNRDVPLDRNFLVGLGWMLSTLGERTIQGGGVVAHHAGATRLFRSQIYLLPAHKLGVVVLANSSAAQQLVDRVATEALTLALEAKTGIRQPEPQEVPAADRPETDAELALASGWFTTLAGPVRIHPDGRRLKAEVDGHTLNLTRRADGLYAMNLALLGLIPIKLGVLSEIGLSVQAIDGHQALVARLGTQEMRVGDKLLSPAPLGAWRQRLGRYEIVNLGDDLQMVQGIELTEADGHLVLAMTMADGDGNTARSVLLPTSDADAILLETLRDGGAGVKVLRVDGEERLQLSGYQARRIGH